MTETPRDLNSVLRKRVIAATLKQESYETKLTRKFLMLHGLVGTARKAAESDAGGDLTLAWYSGEYGAGDLAFTSIRLKKPVTVWELGKLSSGTGELWQAYRKEKQYWPHRRLAVIFDYHGDRVSDLILHTRSDLVHTAPLLITLKIRPAPDESLEPDPNSIEPDKLPDTVWIQSLASFMRAYGQSLNLPGCAYDGEEDE